MIELLFLNGPRSGERISLNAERITLGRKSSNNLVVNDPSIAEKHAIFVRDDKGYTIIVHESKPVVVVNGKQILKKRLKHDDSIRLGTVELRFLAPTPPKANDPLKPPPLPTPFQHIFGDTSPPPPPLPGSPQAPLSLDEEVAPPPIAVPPLRHHRRATGEQLPGRNWIGIWLGVAVIGLLIGGGLLLLRQDWWKRKPASPVVERPEPPEELPMPRETEGEPQPPKDGNNPMVGDPLPPLVVGVGPSGLREGAKIHRTSKFPNHQAAVEAAEPGDSVIFDSRDDKLIEVKKPIRDVQFISGSGKWELHADLIDCQFIYHELPQLLQKAGRVERCVFFRCWMKQTHLIYADTVSMYFDERSPLHPKDNPDGGKRPALLLTGFVRNVLIHKPISGSLTATTDKRFDMTWEPSIRIYATDPEGDGRGTYILSPVVFGQRAWTPHHIARGNRITYAHLTTDGNAWADPVLDISRGNDCVVLCTSFGAESATTGDLYTTVPKKLKYASGEEYGRDGPSYRGPAIAMQGQRNRIVAHGDARKQWTVGRKSQLPGLHYSDGIVAADPFLREFAVERGGLSVNFAEHKHVFLMRPSAQGAEFLASPEDPNGSIHYPMDGPDLHAPVFVPLKDLRINAGEFDKLQLQDMTGKTPDEIEKALAADRSIFLGPGTYTFKKTATAGFIVGAGMEKTILQWPPEVDCLQRSSRGAINCTIKGGKMGYNSQAGIGANTGNPKGLFLRTRFTDMKEAAVNLHTSQFQTWQDCEFVGARIGFTHGQEKGPSVYKGDKGAAGGVTIDNLNICNCTFRQMTNRGIDLTPDSVRLGHVGIHNCRFEDLGDGAVNINGGQTHLMQACVVERCGRRSYNAAIQIISNGVAALSHVQVDCRGVKGNPVCVSMKGSAIVCSHCTFAGMPTSLKSEGILAADHLQGDGNVQAPKDSLLCRCRFKNSDLPEGVSLVKETGFVDVTPLAIAPKLDTTPPPEVEGIRIRAIKKQYHRLEWKAATDPESGITQYIISVGDKEIARTPFVYEPPGDAHDPIIKPTYALVFNDPNLMNRDYNVIAVNGAGLTSEGKEALPRRWGAARARFRDKDGNEIPIVRIVDVKGKITGIVNGEGTTIPLAQVGKNGVPHVIEFELGPVLEP